MTSNVNLLPLPEPFAWANPHEAEAFKDGEDHHFTALRYGMPAGDVPLYTAEQVRANVEASIKYYQDMLCQSQDDVMKLSAETEALRAEVQFLRSHRPIARKLAQAETRSDRLAEALLEARQMIRDLLPDATFTKWDALLNLPAAQENDDA